MPMWYLRWCSSFTYFVAFKVFGYRKVVVSENLKNAFPTLSEVERKKIEKAYQRYFCDVLFETIKAFTISEKQLRKYVSFNNSNVFQQYIDQSQSVVVVMGHLGNWEWGGLRFAVEDLHQPVIIYQTLNNRGFDKLMRNMRSRFGSQLRNMKQIFRALVENKGKLTATVFIADQTPPRRDAIWVDFMNQDTAVFPGTAKIAIRYGYPVIYSSIKRIGRGRYDIYNEVLVEDPSNMTVEELTKLHTSRLEKDIRELPETWLWSHRRWKHKR